MNTATGMETQLCSKKNPLMYLLVFLFGLTALGQVTCTRNGGERGRFKWTGE